MAEPENGSSSLAEALARVGVRWTLLVVEALLGGPQRFNDLLGQIPGIAPNILSERLNRLEREGLLIARPYSERPPRAACQLTAEGTELAGTLRLLAHWGARYADPAEAPGTPRAAPFSRPAGTARPATTLSTTSPTTAGPATCNAGTGRSPAHVVVTGEQSPYAEVAAAGELHDGGVVAGELLRSADAVVRAGDPEPVQLAEEMARAADLLIRVQDREAAEHAVENERSRRRQQHVGGVARVVAADLSRRAGPACPWLSRGRRRPGG